MSGFYTSYTPHFALYLPDGMPLLSSHTEIELDTEEPWMRLSVLLDDTSAEFLEESEVIEGLELPQTSPLEPVYVQLWLEAEPQLLADHAAFLNSEEDPAATIAAIEAPIPDGEAYSPFYLLSSYRINQWAIHETQIGSDEFIELSKKPPRPLDE
jgi:hypothetical protein